MENGSISGISGSEGGTRRRDEKEKMFGKIIGIVIIGVIGILLIILGFLLWKKEMITLLHNYHVDKVTPENRKAFCKQSGIGLIVIGTGLLLTGVSLARTDSAYSFIWFASSFLVGLIMMIASGTKYNR